MHKDIDDLKNNNMISWKVNIFLKKNCEFNKIKFTAEKFTSKQAVPPSKYVLITFCYHLL